MSPALRVLQLVTTRRSLRDYQRDLLVQRFAEIAALRQDLQRLQRLSSQRGICNRCRATTTLVLGRDGWSTCSRCRAFDAITRKETA